MRITATVIYPKLQTLANQVLEKVRDEAWNQMSPNVAAQTVPINLQLRVDVFNAFSPLTTGFQGASQIAVNPLYRILREAIQETTEEKTEE